MICTSADTRSGSASANAIAVAAPIELPTSTGRSVPSVAEHRLEVRHEVAVLVGAGVGGRLGFAVAARVVCDQPCALAREQSAIPGPRCGGWR